jgi:carbonic anhydrase
MLQTIKNILKSNTISKIFNKQGIKVLSSPAEILKHDHAELRKKYKIAYQRSTLKLYEMLLRADKTKVQNSFVSIVHANGKYCDLTTPKDIAIGCIDERCQCNNKVNISLAGCGALLDNDELYTRCEDILKECDEINVETIGVSAHAGCGAAALATKTGILNTKNNDELNFTDNDGEELIDHEKAKVVELYFAKRATDVLRNIVKENDYKIRVKDAAYQDVCDMLFVDGSNTSKIHPGMGILVDLQHINQKPRINPQTFLSQNQLPYFLISDTGDRLDDKDDEHKHKKFVSTVRNIDLAAVIAQGEHGMGSDYSLPVVFLTQNDAEIERAKNIIPELEEQLCNTEFGCNEKKYLFAIVDAR